MPFLLDGNPTQGEISEAVNYLLSNFSQSLTADPGTGQISGPTNGVQAYLYRYLAVKYADSFDGTLNFSNTPTSRLYYGLRNTDTATPESTNPADYVWYQVTGGFGTTKLLYYTVTGGRQISLLPGLAAPSALWQSDTGAAIDLDVISGSDGASSRICYAKSASFALASTPSTYQTTGSSGFPPTNTWGGSETWQATPPTLSPNEALFQSDGIYNPMTNLTTWNVPYLSNLKVGALSAIVANLGSITAGSLNAVTITGSDLTIGSSPAISGTTMTGTGSHIYSDGRFITGNSTKNMVFNGSTLTLNGLGSATFGGLNSSVQMPLTPSGTAPTGYVDSFVITKPGYVQISVTGEVDFMSNTTIYPGVYAPVTISLRDITGGSLPGSATGVIDTFQIRMGSAVFLPAFGAATSRLYLPLSWTRITNLPVGTYAIFACSDAGFFDAAGNLGYAVPVTDRLFTGRIDVYQPTV